MREEKSIDSSYWYLWLLYPFKLHILQVLDILMHVLEVSFSATKMYTVFDQRVKLLEDWKIFRSNSMYCKR